MTVKTELFPLAIFNWTTERGLVQFEVQWKCSCWYSGTIRLALLLSRTVSRHCAATTVTRSVWPSLPHKQCQLAVPLSSARASRFADLRGLRVRDQAPNQWNQLVWSATGRNVCTHFSYRWRREENRCWKNLILAHLNLTGWRQVKKPLNFLAVTAVAFSLLGNNPII